MFLLERWIYKDRNLNSLNLWQGSASSISSEISSIFSFHLGFIRDRRTVNHAPFFMVLTSLPVSTPPPPPLRHFPSPSFTLEYKFLCYELWRYWYSESYSAPVYSTSCPSQNFSCHGSQNNGLKLVLNIHIYCNESSLFTAMLQDFWTPHLSLFIVRQYNWW
jgi:hypothetical protein